MRDKLLDVQETFIGRGLIPEQSKILIKMIQEIFSTEKEWLEFNGVLKEEISVKPLNRKKEFNKDLVHFKENPTNSLAILNKIWGLSLEVSCDTKKDFERINQAVDLWVYLKKSGKIQKILKKDIENGFLKNMTFTSEQLIEFYWAARVNLEIKDKVLRTHVGMNLKDSEIDEWIYSVQMGTETKEAWIETNSKSKFTVKQLEKFYTAVRVSYT